MNASKENARQAREAAERCIAGNASEDQQQFLLNFLQAAERKLPTEQAYANDKSRRQTTPSS